VFSLHELNFQLRELDKDIRKSFAGTQFLMIPASEARYFNNKQPFGETVHGSFPSSRHDVRESWNCFALGRYTACVFHSMRVLEKGLHALVHDLNNNHSAGIVFSETVEEANWGNIISEIQLALENPKRTKRLNPIPDKGRMGFYSRASLEFEYFKNAWRDDVSHSRKSYDESSARSVMNHVEAFMRILAERLNELTS
jgi:HEPN domain-containing protein